VGLSEAIKAEQKVKVRWGFIWALWCAILWGLWYVPGTVVWYAPPYGEWSAPLFPGTNPVAEFLTAAVVITTFNALWVLFFLLLWVGVLGKFGELVRTLRNFTNISKWYWLGAICGGPMAIFGSFMAMGVIGGAFSAAAALLYPIVGATIAKLWYHEKVSPRAYLGIILIIIGGILIFNPVDMIANLQNPAAPEVLFLGYLGGAMAFLGWGIEGAIAARALDVSDPDVGITVRFIGECLIWLIIIIPLTVALGWNTLPMMAATVNASAQTWLVAAGITFGYCYVSWYKSFPLIGVGRGQAVGALYGPLGVIFVTLFLSGAPAWWLVAGVIVAVIGTFIMYYLEGAEVEETTREIPA